MKIFYKANCNNFIYNIAVKSNVDGNIRISVKFNEGNNSYLYDGPISKCSTVIISQEIIQQYKGASFYILSDVDIHATIYLRGIVYD